MPWYAYCRRITITSPLWDVALAEASTILSELSSWLSIPVTSTVLWCVRNTLASQPSIPPFAPLSTSDPRNLGVTLCRETLYVVWECACKSNMGTVFGFGSS